MTPREGGKPKEPIMTINGVLLTYGQAMTMRVALTGFHSDMVTNGLGDDEIGQAIAAGYIARSDFRQGTFASGRMAGLREGVNIVERALLCTGRGVFSNGVRAGCKYIRGELTQQIEQAAQGQSREGR